MRKGVELKEKANAERASGHTIYPADEDLFRALQLTSPEHCRVLIIGQDPYHEPGQANGLAFSVNDGMRFPPSLRNIFKELSADIGCNVPASGDLTRWAEQGVLLLNYTLTVEQGKANSHKDWGWYILTNAVVQAFLGLEQTRVCLAWGKFAIDAVRYAGVPARGKYQSICSTHPSPLSANRAAGDIPAFIGSKPFSKINQFFAGNGENEIAWELAL